MSINKEVTREIETIDELEKELNRLLSTIKPSDKLVIGDTFLVEKDVHIPGSKNDIIKENSVITIVDIIKGGEGKTDKVYYVIDLSDKTYKMSKGIFVLSFCKDIISKEEELSKQIMELRNKIKELRDKIKNKDISEESEKVQKRVNFLLRISKMFSKKYN